MISLSTPPGTLFLFRVDRMSTAERRRMRDEGGGFRTIVDLGIAGNLHYQPVPCIVYGRMLSRNGLERVYVSVLRYCHNYIPLPTSMFRFTELGLSYTQPKYEVLNSTIADKRSTQRLRMTRVVTTFPGTIPPDYYTYRELLISNGHLARSTSSTTTSHA